MRLDLKCCCGAGITFQVDDGDSADAKELMQMADIWQNRHAACLKNHYLANVPAERREGSSHATN